MKRISLALALVALPLGMLLAGGTSRDARIPTDPSDLLEVRQETPIEQPASAPGVEAAAIRSMPRVLAEGGQADAALAASETEATLRCRVVDALGNAVLGTTVEFHSKRRTAPIRKQTNANGVAELRVEGPGDGTLTIGGSEWGQRTLNLSAAPAGSNHDLGDVVLTPGCTLSGTVLDVHGAALDNVEIELSPARHAVRWTFSAAPTAAGELPAEHRTQTHLDGSFELSGIQRGHYRVTARHRGYAALTLGSLELPNDGTPLRLQLQRASALLGRVMDEHGAGVTGAKVAMVHISRLRSASSTLEAIERFGQFADDSGEFVLRGHQRSSSARPGNYVLAATAPGYALRVREIDNVLDLHEIALPFSGTIEGQLVDAGGNPIDGIRVSASYATQHDPPHGVLFEKSVTTSADGSYVFRKLPLGTLELHSSSLRGSLRQQVECGIGTGHLRLVLPREEAHQDSLVSVDVTDSAGARLAGQRVLMRSLSEVNPTFAYQTTDWRGQASWRAPRGLYEIALRDRNGSATRDRVKIQVAPGTPVHVPLRQRATATLHVHVLRAGQPVPGAVVDLAPEGDHRQLMNRMHLKSPYTRTDNAGTATLVAEPGRYVVFAISGSRVVPSLAEIEIVGGTQELTLNLDGATVTGRVLAPNGDPVTNVRVRLTPRHFAGLPEFSQTARYEITPGIERTTRKFSMGEVTVRTDAAGVFRFHDAPDGWYALELRASGYAESVPDEVYLVGHPHHELGSFTLQPICDLAIRLSNLPHLLSGEAGTSAAALLTPEGAAVRSSSVSPAGGVRFEGLAPGSYQLLVRIGAERHCFQGIVVAPKNNNIRELDWSRPSDC